MKTLISFVVAFVVSLALVGCKKEEAPRQPWQYGPTISGHTTGTTATVAPVSTYGNNPLYVDENGVAHMRITETGKVIATTPASGIEHGVRQVTTAARFGTAWVLLALGILVPGPLVILFIPGFIVGRAEKVLEGLALCAWGFFMLNLTADAEAGSLNWWVWGVLVVPGALLLMWGLVSDNEAGKFILVVGPVIVFALYLFAQLYRMLVLGAAGSAIFTFLILAFTAAILLGAINRLGGTSSA